MPRPGAPERTCVGCRTARPKHELLRVVARDGELIADPAQTEPGRGGYVCARPGCIERAVARRTFARALRTPVSASAETVDWMYEWRRSASLT